MSDVVPEGAPASYPVVFDIERQLTDRNRLTTAFRIILAIPHILLVGGGIGLGSGNGALGYAAEIVAVIAWFAIVFTAAHPRGLWDFAAFFLRWKVRAGAYLALLRDEYPPFGDGPYPTTFEVSYPEAPRDRLSVGLRIFYAIPHIIVLAFLGIAWAVTTIIAWFAILFTARYPEGLYEFAVGVMRWSIRVEAYVLLMRDEYPPFSMQP